MMKTSESTPAARAYKRIGDWLSHNSLSRYLASNTATFVSVDFPAGIAGSCAHDCHYCYARRGHQAYAQPRACQETRYRQYLDDPERFAQHIVSAIHDVNRRYLAPVSLPIIGSPDAPLRLFGCGDIGDVLVFDRFAAALDCYGIAWYGYSRYRVNRARMIGTRARNALNRLWFSVDRYTPQRHIIDAVYDGRRIAYARLSADDVPPMVADVVFPEHHRCRYIPIDSRDCFKLRYPHDIGACYFCKRCF